ncbi:MAG: MGMT family protein [Bacteroidia bacterium]|nr:MGMT family protein [Bacteroidia bacterium]MDW8089335.1 MGMT family protein [Bacteroidia bacterium]
MPRKTDLDFFAQVWAVVRAVPPGRVTTYGAIAQYLSAARAARLVGYALRASLNAHPPVPAHRVVNRHGLLTGKFGFSPPTLMAERLQAEGVLIENDRVQNFAQKFWDPSYHLPPAVLFFQQLPC